MEKDLKELASKYDSLTDLEKIDLEVKAHGEATNEWFLNRPEEIVNLMTSSWFHLHELGLEIGEDGRLRLKKVIISEIPEGEIKENLKSASDFISNYFTIVVKFLENPELIKSEPPNQDDSGDWGEEEFLIGLLDKRRGGGFELFE
ncbi:hypothetical protein K9M78_01365 [Candidatus Bipolaricaulota bacterium]|nr:hypothetical protein [Candidatus Bipolaricaulota bacterium]